MGIKKYNPTTPSRRWGSVLDYSEITKTKPEKSLLEPLPKHGGRNNHGGSPAASVAAATSGCTA